MHRFEWLMKTKMIRFLLHIQVYFGIPLCLHHQQPLKHTTISLYNSKRNEKNNPTGVDQHIIDISGWNFILFIPLE